jgi:hypothetical protein
MSRPLLNVEGQWAFKMAEKLTSMSSVVVQRSTLAVERWVLKFPESGEERGTGLDGGTAKAPIALTNVAPRDCFGF